MEIDRLKKFLDKNYTIGFIGATTNKEKWGYKKYKELKDQGFKVYPINPKYNEIYGDPCFPDLETLIDRINKKPDLVITIIPPNVTEKVAEKCKILGINKIWMQPGSESQKIIDFCNENSIETVHGVCIVVDALRKM